MPRCNRRSSGHARYFWLECIPLHVHVGVGGDLGHNGNARRRFLLSVVVFRAPFSRSDSRVRTTKDKQTSDSSTEPFVIRHLSTKVVFENDGTSSLESTASVLIQSQAGLHDFGVLNFPYASGTSTFQVGFTCVFLNRTAGPSRHPRRTCSTCPPK